MSNGARLKIVYENSAGERCEREISDLRPNDFLTFLAFCHLRQAERTFTFSGVKEAVDTETGEVLSDLRPLVGLTSYPEVRVQRRQYYPPREQRQRRNLTTEEVQALRGKQKYQLRKTYRIQAVYEHYKGRLLSAFSNRCFRCGAPPPLDLDHFVPIMLGGDLLPGNITPLCRRCNDLKGDSHPEDFYTSAELERLLPLLEGEVELMSFEWSWLRWDTDQAGRRAYLLEIGLNREVVHEMFTNPEHPWYVAHPETLICCPPPEPEPFAPEKAPMPDISWLTDPEAPRICVFEERERIRMCIVRLPDVVSREPDPGYFRGYCDSCGEMQSFQYERIRAVKDVRTGQLIPSLYELLMRRFMEGRRRASWKAWLGRHRTPLEAAAFVGRVSRAKDEILEATLLSFVRERLQDPLLPKAELMHEISMLGKHAQAVFEDDIDELRKDRENRVSVSRPFDGARGDFFRIV